jgi:serine/threonine protein kinase
MQTIQHPFIIPIKHSFATTFEKKVHQVIVSDWFDGINLELDLKDRKRSHKIMKEHHVIQIFSCVLMAIDLLHTDFLYHGKISSAHVYVQLKNDVYTTVKLGDYANLEF